MFAPHRSGIIKTKQSVLNLVPSVERFRHNGAVLSFLKFFLFFYFSNMVNIIRHLSSVTYMHLVATMLLYFPGGKSAVIWCFPFFFLVVFHVFLVTAPPRGLAETIQPAQWFCMSLCEHTFTLNPSTFA